MKLKSFLFLHGLFFIIIFFIITSCQHEIIIPPDYVYKGPCNCPGDSIPVIKDKPCSTDTVYFRNVILPLIQSSCAMATCHDINSGGELRPLVSYNTIRQSGYVVGGSASNSKLYEQLFKTDPQDRMPPAPYSPLNQEQKDLIKKWIDQGAKDNYCSTCDTTTFKFASVIWLIIRDNCLGCHSGTNPGKGVPLQNYTDVHAIVLDGRLKNVLNATNGFKQMPQGGKLMPCKIIQINKWIANGALND